MRTNDSITRQEMNMQMLHLQKGQDTAAWLCEDRAQLGTAGHALPPLPACPKPSVSTQRVNPGVTGSTDSNPTLEGAVGLLGQGEVLLTEQVHGLVLADLHAGAHIAVPVQEKGERAGQVLTAKATAENKPEVQNFK